MQLRNVILLRYGPAWSGYKFPLESPYHLLMFMEKGSCVYRIRGVRYAVEEGDALFIGEGIARQAEATSGAHVKYSVHWNGSGLFRHFPLLTNEAVLFKSASLHAYLKQSYVAMYDLWSRKDLFYLAQCESLLLEIAVRLHQDRAERQKAGKQVHTLRQVRDYILAYYRQPLSIDELAHHVKRNASYLITSFKKQYGLAPLEFMHRTRITKAEELLLTTDATIEAIAEELGYCDGAYFNRIFKKWTGTTPSAYRKHL